MGKMKNGTNHAALEKEVNHIGWKIYEGLRRILQLKGGSFIKKIKIKMGRSNIITHSPRLVPRLCVSPPYTHTHTHTHTH